MTRKIFVCGGGTGGHFFCGLALAEKYLESNSKDEAHFMGVRRGIEGRYRFEDSRMKVHFVKAGGLKNLGFFDKVFGALALVQGVLQAFWILWKERPWLVIGVGGYSSVPGVLAGLLLKPLRKMRVVVVDQNSSPGLANKVFSKIGAESYGAFPAKGFECIELPNRRSVEERLVELRAVEWPPKTLLVMGGSQGAQGLNQAWIGLLEDLQKNYPELQIMHQTGKLGFQFVRAAYENLGMKAEVFEFSDRIGDFMAKSDLIVSRAGALSLFEMMAYQRPAVLVPFPQAADNHQFKNAEAVQNMDWIIGQHRLNWESFREILTAPEPRVLEWRKGRRSSWRKIFRPLAKA